MIKGNKTLLIPVTEDDSREIINLRNNPAISKYLSGDKKLTLYDQIQWIRNNNTNPNNFYWKICNVKNEFCGTISLYNINAGKAEFGRYICTNPIQAIESELMLIRFAFQVCNLNEIYCRTVIDNVKVWQQHYSFGFKDFGEEKLLDRNFILKIQTLAKETFNKFDYSNIDKLIARF